MPRKSICGLAERISSCELAVPLELNQPSLSFPSNNQGADVSPAMAQGANAQALPADHSEGAMPKGGNSIPDRLVIDEYELGPLLRKVDEICHALKSGFVDPETLDQVLRDAVSCAVKQFLSQREFRALAFTDELTGLYNRRGFRAVATQQLKLAYRESRECLLFLADVDRLKEINDSYGHREGDLTLVCVADALNLTFRDSDVTARLGGDEFVALASNTSPYDEGIILRRLRKNLHELGSSGPRHEVSLTVGVARFDPLHPVLFEDLVVQADEAMYKRKRR